MTRSLTDVDRWRLSGPAGQGERTAVSTLARTRTSDGIVWTQVVDGAAPAGRDAPVLHLGGKPAGEGWRRTARLPSWGTGPDPFVPTQAPLIDPGPAHDALALRLAAGGRAAVRSWSGASEVEDGPALGRGSAWLRWRLAEPGAELEAMQIGSERCSGWVLLKHLPHQIRILDLQAEDRVSHYALLKAARRRSWERGGAPVVLHGELMSKRYAFTAGYVPIAPMLSVWTRGGAGPARAWEADR